ncbi:hypothetical protein B1C81_15770 [Streptomyces sp. HG99]|nr:hypothetical protein B1C81_15770 [Streptomyces sp. HG99]
MVTVHPVRDADKIQRPYQGPYMSARRYVMKTFSDSKSPALRARAERFLTNAPCPACGGTKLRPEALEVTFAGSNIAELAALPLTELVERLERAAERESTSETARVLTDDLRERIAPILELGLGYISLDRATPTLSVGEPQRLCLATQLRFGLFGVLTVRQRGATFAGWVIDLGPGGGDAGGRIAASGPPAEVAREDGSRTAPNLARALPRAR